MVMSSAYFGPRHSPYSYYYCRTSDIAAVGSTFNVFSYDAVWVENQTSPTPDGCVTVYVTDADYYKAINKQI